ncbi:MAG: hypothetical protein HQ465_25640, partial [Rhodospirillales bacterium]|nr:hypothetical protein [Rhodospirillales bacterium]
MIVARAIAWVALMAALMVALSGCSAFNYVAADSPVPEVSVAPMTPA